MPGDRPATVSPASFVAAWRHLHRLFEAAGAHNVANALAAVGVAHADAERDVEDLSGRVRAKRPRASFDLVTVLGPVIGTHGGPGTLGLFWYDDQL